MMQKKTIRGKVSQKVNVSVVMRIGPDGTVSAECPEIPGCTVQGDNEQDAEIKIKAAIEGCLAALITDGVKRARNEKTFSAGFVRSLF